MAKNSTETPAQLLRVLASRWSVKGPSTLNVRKPVLHPERPAGRSVRRKRVRRRYSGLANFADWTMARFGMAEPVVLVSGFWRSGTTWLQECLAESLDAKTVFEPLSTNSPRRKRYLQRAGVKSAVIREALIPPQLGQDDDLWAYLDSSFRAHSGDFYSLYCRKSIRESFRRTIVLKDVRLQFNLTGVHERFGIPIIHVRRHPAAVVESLLRTGWPWSFEDVSLAEILPGRAAELARYDDDLISRVSAYWALTERFVDETLSGQPWARIVSYEEAVSDPAVFISELCDFIGRTQRRIPIFDAPSSSTTNYLKLASFRAQPSGWRTALSPETIARIQTIIAELYPEYEFP